MMYYSTSERAETDVAIIVNESKMKIVVTKIVCNNNVIALKLKVKPVKVSLVQVYMATSEYKHDEVEELHNKG